MKSLTYCLVGALFILASCGKEKSFELGQPSRGSLQSNTSGECLNKTVNATYKAGAALGDTNTITVNVDVVQTGPYTITTDTINGYSFKATGSFTATGNNTVILKGSGTPIVAGVNNFTVTYDVTSCTVAVTVLPGSVPGGPAAVYTVVGAGATCGSSVNGTYTQGSALTGANTVTLQLNVTTAGTYSISTNTVNGITFSGTGTLSGTGAQTVTLAGSGTPTPAGNPTFLVTAGSNTCNFSLTINPASNPQPGGLFPMTLNSWWSYSDPFTQNTSDTIKTVVTGTEVGGGNTYYVFETTDEVGDSFESYYRKNGDNYYEFISVVDYYADIAFDVDVSGEILFLKENLAKNATWTSSEYSGQVNGAATRLRYQFTAQEVNLTVDINGRTFTGVYKIKLQSQVSTNGGASWNSESHWWETLYAPNVGIILQRVYIPGSPNPQVVLDMPIRYWNVK